MIHKTEYYPSTHGLKNIYNKLLSLGATITNHSVIEYDDTVKQKVISSYISDGESPDMAKYIVDYFEYIYEHR